MVKQADLTREIARPAQMGLRSVWQWRPLASLTPAAVADLLRRAAMGDAHDFLIAADDIREKDLHYRAVLQTRTLAVAGLPWDVQPWDDSAPAKRAAELVTEALAGLDLPGLIAHLMDAVAKGYAVAEIIWQTDGGRWLPREVLAREAHWFRFDTDTGRILRLVDGSAEGAEIPPYRMIVHAPPVTSGIPLLGGVARSALWAWVFKSYALRDWARFVELFGQPIRVGKYHQGASPDDVAVLKKAAFELGSDAAAVIPQEMALELIESGGKSASADLYHKLIDYLDRQVSKAVLGQTMTTDDGSSKAQAQVHDAVRRELIEADARAMATTLARDLIAPLVRLNLGDAPLPTFRLLVEDPDDLTALADHVTKLHAAGMPIPQWWVREKFGIPEAQEGDAVLGASAPQAEPQRQIMDCGCAVHALQATNSGEADDAAADQQALDDALTAIPSETLMRQAWEAAGPAMRRALAAGDYQSALGMLAELYPAMPDDGLQDLLARLLFAAQVWGALSADAELADGRS